MINKNKPELMNHPQQQNANEITPSNEVSLAYISGIIRQLDKINQDAASRLSQVQSSLSLRSKEEQWITEDLTAHAKLSTRYNPETTSGEFSLLLADKRDLMQIARQMVDLTKGELGEEEEKEATLADLLLEEKDLFLFFHIPRFGHDSLKETIFTMQNDLRESLLYRDRIEKTNQSLGALYSKINQLNLSMVRLLM